MELFPSSRLTFLNDSGAIIQGPVEGRKCGIGIDVPRELWPSISLRLGTVALSLQFDEMAMRASSEWPPCGPGHYELVLVCGDIQECLALTVMPRYFNENEVASIVYDLTELLPKSIAARLQECGGLLDLNLAQEHESPIVQFFKVRRAISGTKDRLGIVQLLPVIQRQCHHVLVSRHELRDTDKSRRPAISKLPQAISMPGNVLSGSALKQMFDITVERSFETYENRLVKAYVQALRGQISRLQARLQSEPALSAAATELERLSDEFRLACARATFLKAVRLPFVSADRVTMVLLKNPAYRAIWEDYLALHKHTSIRLEEPRLSAPLNNFPFLYQQWANLTVVSVILRVCAELGYQCVSHPWVQRDNNGLFLQIMPDFEVAFELTCPTTGRSIRLVSWRSESGRDNTLSTSQDLPPALAVGIYAAEKPPEVLVFDAKYRVSETVSVQRAIGKKTSAKAKAAKNESAETCSAIEPMKGDVDELLYVLDQLRTPGGVREIQYATILYPGQRKQIAPDLEVLPARPSDWEALQTSVCAVLRRYLA